MSAEVRAPREDHAPALARFLEDHALAAYGESELSEEEVRHWFTLPGIWMRVAERDSRVAGYVDVVARDGGTRFDADARTLGCRAADALRDFAGRGAVRVGLGVDAESTTGAVRLYEGAGMQVVRCNDVYEKAL